MAVQFNPLRLDPLEHSLSGCGALFTAALYHLFIRRHASFAFGGSPPSSASISFPASSTLRFLSPFRLALKARPSIHSLARTLVPLFAETLLSASLHVSSEIHAFLCFSRSCGFGTACRRSPKSSSSLVGSFGYLRRAVPKPHEREKHRNTWISEETWRLANERVSAKRGAIVRARLRRLGRVFRAILKGGSKRRVEDTGKDVEALLGGDPPNAKEAWRRM